MNVDVKSLPPGVTCDSAYKYYDSAGDEEAWFEFPQIKYYTNAFIVKDDQVLLGFKKRGFGKGKYNGFGGKVEPGESSLQAAIRELEEESGVVAPLKQAGSFLFYTQGAEWAFHIDIYTASTYEGNITETDEMRPEWFSLGQRLPKGDLALFNERQNTDAPTEAETSEEEHPGVPYENMWETDIVWLPLLFSGKKFIGRADFVQTADKFEPRKWWYGLVLQPEPDSPIPINESES
ncbi:hypothetical protein D9619_010845 [Psilocybe cf. subviscida]|uniref:Oxidized purine nucleoside triphosphate hydrolase n=1 Tax=Psilocybe cf. subviscida TaxID=2480587 RepID=A0A8H5B8B1_9AGAR|nr:hypothetical protein D9619_010845 [Psilocybe cf. subviscida]